MAEAEAWRMAKRLAAKLEDKERLTTMAASLDLTSLEALLTKQLKGEDIPSLLTEYRRFLVIKVQLVIQETICDLLYHFVLL